MFESVPQGHRNGASPEAPLHADEARISHAQYLSPAKGQISLRSLAVLTGSACLA